MSQVQSMVHMHSKEGVPCIESVAHDSVEAFQNSARTFHFVDPTQQQQYLAYQSALSRDNLWQYHETPQNLLDGESLAQLSLGFQPGSCNLHATVETGFPFRSNHCTVGGSHSPVSISSSSPIASQFFQQSRETSLGASERVTHASPQFAHHRNMVNHRLPATPQSTEDEYQNLQHLSQYNTAFGVDENLHPGSGHVTAYGSPASTPWAYPDQTDERYQLRGHGSTTEWQNGEPHYNHLYPTQYAPQNPMIQVETRPAPQTRSRASSPLKTRKTQGKAKAGKSTEKLKAPLSELTKDMSTPLRNMADWVNRSAEERQREVEKKNGYVSRPMNSFMLYRSAYAERTKAWCTQNNHQVVSSVSGESWPMEPDSVRGYYTELARIERDNHQRAHPGYKFSPSKANTTARKRKGNAYSDDDAETDADGSDFEYVPGRARRSKAQQQPVHRSGEVIAYQGPNSFVRNVYGEMRPVDRSTLYATNLGRPPPADMANMNSYEDHGQYFAHTVVPTPYTGHRHFEDIRITRAHAPSAQHQAPSGLPGANHDDLFGDNFDASNLPFGDEQMDPTHQLDPNLLGFDQGYGAGVFTDQSFHDLDGDFLAQQTGQTSSELHPAMEGALNSWEGEDALKDFVENSNK